jgi:hypothetical protein
MAKEPGNRRSLARFKVEESLREEFALISRGVQSLRNFVEHLQSEGGTHTTNIYIKVL